MNQVDFDEEGQLGDVLDRVTSYLDGLIFVYPAHQVQIAGIRSGIVGQTQGLGRSSTARIRGNMSFGPGNVVSTLMVDVI